MLRRILGVIVLWVGNNYYVTINFIYMVPFPKNYGGII